MELTKMTVAGGFPLSKRFAKSVRKGLTLIEAAMVLAILALVIAGIMLFYTQANSSRLTTAALNDLAAVQQTVRSLYGGQSEYTGITTAIIADSKNLPSKMTSGSTLRHSFNGSITIAAADAGGGTGSGFSVEFANVPKEACVKMLSSDLGRGLYSAGASTVRNQTSGLPFSPTQATASCNTANNTITWIFN